MKNRKLLLKNLATVLIPMLLSVVVMGILSIAIIYSYLSEELQKNSMNTLSSVKFNIEQMMRDMDQFAYNFSSNPDMITQTKDVLSTATYNYGQKLSYQFILNFIDTPVDTNPYMHSVYVYYLGYDRLLCSDAGIIRLEQFFDQQWVKKLPENRDERTRIELREVARYGFENHPTNLVTVYRTMLSPGTSQPDGLLTMNLYEDYVSDLLLDQVSYEGQKILVLDAGGEAVFSSGGERPPDGWRDSLDPDAENGASRMLDGVEYRQYATSSPQYGLTYISLVPVTAGVQLAGQQIFITVLVMLLVVLVGSTVAVVSTQRSRAQLLNIVNILSEYETTGKYPTMEKTPSNVYDLIVYNILGVFVRGTQMKMQLVERKYQMDIYELKALQAQMNPHFLYNVLDTINWKAMEVAGGYSPLNEMIENLSRILKYCLSNAEEKIPLREEIAYMKCYAAIQNARYNNQLVLVWKYDEEDLELPVMKLTFQPLIENSIKHGGLSGSKSVAIKIRVQRRGDRLLFTIIDNGVGMSQARLVEVRRSLAHKWQDDTHIGLINTNQRMRLTYGDAYNMRIYSREGLGTAIHFSLPCSDEAPARSIQEE